MMVIWLIQFFPGCLESILAWGTALSTYPNLRITWCAWAPYYPGITRNDLQSLIKTKWFCASWQPGSCLWRRWPPNVCQKSKCSDSQEHWHGRCNPKEWVFRRMHFHNHVQISKILFPFYLMSTRQRIIGAHCQMKSCLWEQNVTYSKRPLSARKIGTWFLGATLMSALASCVTLIVGEKQMVHVMIPTPNTQGSRHDGRVTKGQRVQIIL